MTYANSTDFYLKSIKGGVALSILTDDQNRGTYQSTLMSLAYAQHITLADENLRIIPSFQVSYGQISLDRSSLSFGSVISPRHGVIWNSGGIPSPNRRYVDFSSGALVSYKNRLFAGAYWYHLTEPDIGLLGAYRLPSRYLLHASYSTSLSEKSLLQLLYRADLQNRFFYHQVSANLLLKNHLLAGAGVTSQQTILVSAGFRNEYLSILGGYDVNLSKLAGNSAGSLELHAGFYLRKKEKRHTLTSFESF